MVSCQPSAYCISVSAVRVHSSSLVNLRCYCPTGVDPTGKLRVQIIIVMFHTLLLTVSPLLVDPLSSTGVPVVCVLSTGPCSMSFDASDSSSASHWHPPFRSTKHAKIIKSASHIIVFVKDCDTGPFVRLSRECCRSSLPHLHPPPVDNSGHKLRHLLNENHFALPGLPLGDGRGSAVRLRRCSPRL